MDMETANHTSSPMPISTLRRRRSVKATLGVFQTQGSTLSLTSGKSAPSSSSSLQIVGKKSSNKSCQTLLSFPSPSHKPEPTPFRNLASKTKNRLIPTSYSIDDVMRLVDTEEDDVIILSELANQCVSGSMDDIRKNNLTPNNAR